METLIQNPVEKKFRHGLVVGRFFPPSQGHLFLIRSAAEFCRHVTVCIEGQEHAAMSLEILRDVLRKDVREKNVSVVVLKNKNPGDIFSTLQAKGILSKENTVDAVFSSDSSNELSKKINCDHVLLDVERACFPISAQLIRKDPVLHWFQIVASAQSYFCKKIVIVGAESTGKTTLAGDLAKHYRSQGAAFSTTPEVPEFGREYTLAKLAVMQASAQRLKQPTPGMNQMQWSEKDFVHIAQVQNQWELDASLQHSPLMICDTDSLATAIWHERYRNHMLNELEPLIQSLMPRTLYILVSASDVPFQADNIRDGEHLRNWMTERFETELKKRNQPFVQIPGSREKRLATAISEIDKRLQWNWE